jgi:hypothetical protein
MNSAPCIICQQTNHNASKCPELWHPEKAGGGGGGTHSHDDDDENCYIHLSLFKCILNLQNNPSNNQYMSVYNFEELH